MTSAANSIIRNIATGVPGLDMVLGGGICEYSFNLIAGAPGSGKTTLAQQILFANATTDHPALYFTVLGEPTVKMIRYQQEFTFFDAAKIPSAIRFVNLGAEVLDGSADALLARFEAEVSKREPAFVVVDSFRAMAAHLTPGNESGALVLDGFLQRLAQHLTSWETTSFLVSEYSEIDREHPVFAIADSIIWLSEDVDRSSAVRMLRALKIRGRSPMSGLHPFRITQHGLEVFPRIREQQRNRVVYPGRRLHTGVPGLDEMMGGGIPEGDVVMLTGPLGSGKTTFALQFMAQGLIDGDNCVVAVFEEYPGVYLARAKGGIDFARMIAEERLAVLYLRPMTLSVDEMLVEIVNAVRRIGATRVVIDSLSGFEIALAPAFRRDFSESVYRLVGALTAVGVTVLMTAEVTDVFPRIQFTTESVAFVADDMLVQWFVESDGRFERVLSIVKMRGSEHSMDIRRYDLTSTGGVVGKSTGNKHGIATGVPRRDRRRSALGNGGDDDD